MQRKMEKTVTHTQTHFCWLPQVHFMLGTCGPNSKPWCALVACLIHVCPNLEVHLLACLIHVVQTLRWCALCLRQMVQTSRRCVSCLLATCVSKPWGGACLACLLACLIHVCPKPWVAVSCLLDTCGPNLEVLACLRQWGSKPWGGPRKKKIKLESLTYSSFLGHGVFVVVHPNLEYMTLHTKVCTKFLNSQFIMLLHFPAKLFSKVVHLILLFSREFSPEPFLNVWRWASSSDSSSSFLFIRICSSCAHCHHGYRSHGWFVPLLKLGDRGRVSHCGCSCQDLLYPSFLCILLVAVTCSNLSLNFSSMEISMAATSCTFESIWWAFFSQRHEFPTPIYSMAS